MNCDLILYGKTTSENGIPVPFHRYRIEVSENPVHQNYIATVWGADADTPMPDNKHYSSQKSAADAAKGARKAIGSLQENQGLSENTNCP